MKLKYFFKSIMQLIYDVDTNIILSRTFIWALQFNDNRKGSVKFTHKQHVHYLGLVAYENSPMFSLTVGKLSAAGEKERKMAQNRKISCCSFQWSFWFESLTNCGTACYDNDRTVLENRYTRELYVKHWYSDQKVNMYALSGDYMYNNVNVNNNGG